MRIVCFLAVILFFSNCSNDPENFPAAQGMPGEIILVMDSAQWKGPLGRAIDSIFSTDIAELPRKESVFRLRWVSPHKFNSALKLRRNLIFALSLDKTHEKSQFVKSVFTAESIEKIKSAPDDFIKTNDNIYSKGQEVMFLYGVNEKILTQKVKAKASGLISFFNQKERERLTESLFRSGQLKGVSQALVKDFQCDLKVPFGYQLADKQADFVWVRQINPKDDKNVFIARKPYTSQKDFSKENLIRFRDEVCRKYLFEDPAKPDTYILTELNVPFLPVTVDTTKLGNNFAIQVRGIWRSNTMGMGGPFEGFALVDEGTQQFYYIEGFVFSPGRSQRELMRELETILYTFRTSKDLLQK
ncbi:hypothetical protein BH10BAC4_BH10BAC4_14720 [soil metagenome]